MCRKLVKENYRTFKDKAGYSPINVRPMFSLQIMFIIGVAEFTSKQVTLPPFTKELLLELVGPQYKDILPKGACIIHFYSSKSKQIIFILED